MSGMFISYSTCASASAPQEVSAEERQKILEKFKILHKDMHSIFSSVTQEKRLAALKKKVFVEGTVLMAKPNMLKWDIVKPVRSVTVIDGETLTVYHPDSKEAQVYTLSENFIARNSMSFFSTIMSGDLNEIQEKFSVTIFRMDDEVVFNLVPMSKMVRRYVSAIVIHYDAATGLPKDFELSTPKGDKTVTRLTNIKVNPELKPETFRIRLPGDVSITNKIEPMVSPRNN